MKSKLLISLAFLLIAVGLCFSFFVVKEYEYAIVTQFGRPVKEISTPGCYVKIPFGIQKINRFDKRTAIFETTPIQLLLGDKNPIIAGCYVAWEVKNPLLFFQAIGYPENAVQKLSEMVVSQLGILLGDYETEQIINSATGVTRLPDIEEKLKKNTNLKSVEKYGIGIIRIGIQRLAYPEIVLEAVYQRMQSERNKEAAKLRAEGQEEAMKIKSDAYKKASAIQAEAFKESEILKGQGDQIAMKLYADAYSNEPEFFSFLQSLETYKKIFNSETTLILSTDSQLFEHLQLNGKAR